MTQLKADWIYKSRSIFHIQGDPFETSTGIIGIATIYRSGTMLEHTIQLSVPKPSDNGDNRTSWHVEGLMANMRSSQAETHRPRIPRSEAYCSICIRDMTATE